MYPALTSRSKMRSKNKRTVAHLNHYYQPIANEELQEYLLSIWELDITAEKYTSA